MKAARITCKACTVAKLLTAFRPGTSEPRRARHAVCRECRSECARLCRAIVDMAGSQEKAGRILGIQRRTLWGYLSRRTYPAEEIRQAIRDTYRKLRERDRVARFREAMARRRGERTAAARKPRAQAAENRRRCERCKSLMKTNENLWCTGCIAWARRQEGESNA